MVPWDSSITWSGWGEASKLHPCDQSPPLLKPPSLPHSGAPLCCLPLLSSRVCPGHKQCSLCIWELGMNVRSLLSARIFSFAGGVYELTESPILSPCDSGVMEFPFSQFEVKKRRQDGHFLKHIPVQTHKTRQNSGSTLAWVLRMCYSFPLKQTSLCWCIVGLSLKWVLRNHQRAFGWERSLMWIRYLHWVCRATISVRDALPWYLLKRFKFDGFALSLDI